MTFFAHGEISNTKIFVVYDRLRVSAGAVCSIKESPGPQNQQVQKVMSQRSAGLCTRANAFPKYLQQIFIFISD